MGFPSSSDGKESTCDEGDTSSIPGLGRSPEGGHSNPLQCSCMENLMNRRAWQATIHGVTKSQTQLKQLSMYKEYSGCQFNTPDSVSGKGLTWVEEGYLVAGNEYPSVSSSEIAIQFI